MKVKDIRRERIIVERVYDFYDAPEAERLEVMDYYFTEKDRYTYFPIFLHKDEFNYGRQQGLLCISPILKTRDNNKKWFKVFAFSPDDLDLDLEFEADETHLRQVIIEFLKNHTFVDATYEGALGFIRDKFNAGVLE